MWILAIYNFVGWCTITNNKLYIIYTLWLFGYNYFIMTFGFYQMRLMCGAVATITICIYAVYTVNIDWLIQT